MGLRVVIMGATGMIGGLVLNECTHSDEISEIVSFSRRSTGIENYKLREVIVDDFLNLDKYAEMFQSVDIVYYCLGVYTGAVSSEKFREITVDYPEHLASMITYKRNTVFCLLSGAGADRSEKSRVIFAKYKGAIENRLSGMGFKSFHAFRPSYIYPVVKRNEPNVSYKLLRALYPVIKLFGKSVSISSTELARAIFMVGLESHPLEILENRDILKVVENA